jgi:hypothetical protein
VYPARFVSEEPSLFPVGATHDTVAVPVVTGGELVSAAVELVELVDTPAQPARMRDVIMRPQIARIDLNQLTPRRCPTGETNLSALRRGRQANTGATCIGSYTVQIACLEINSFKIKELGLGTVAKARLRVASVSPYADVNAQDAQASAVSP